MEQPSLNDHNKQEYPPMHTTEHVINRTMVNLFGCGRAISAHIERKKSKLDFALQTCLYLANLHTSFLCNLIYPTFSRILLYSC